MIDDGGIGFCVCVDNKNKVVGVVTDGDFRRAVYNGIKLDSKIKRIMNRKFYYVEKNYDLEETKKIFNETIVEQIPVLDNGILIDIISVDNYSGKDKKENRRSLDNSVIIMAGGSGKRLDPFTRILPKPLIPLGNEPIIKVIMDEFRKFGMDNFFITLNDKGRMIKAYFNDHDLNYNIEFIEEKKPLGTAGSLKYLEGKLLAPFFVSNCDIIIHANYFSIYEFHKKGSYDLTLLGSMQQYSIPYGVCEIDNGGILKGIKEKPEFDILVNTGFYLLNPNVLNHIPENEYFDMTDLIEKIKGKGLKIGVYPVSEKSWIDVGQWSKYNSTINELFS